MTYLKEDIHKLQFKRHQVSMLTPLDRHALSMITPFKKVENRAVYYLLSIIEWKTILSTWTRKNQLNETINSMDVT